MGEFHPLTIPWGGDALLLATGTLTRVIRCLPPPPTDALVGAPGACTLGVPAAAQKAALDGLPADLAVALRTACAGRRVCSSPDHRVIGKSQKVVSEHDCGYASMVFTPTVVCGG